MQRGALHGVKGVNTMANEQVLPIDGGWSQWSRSEPPELAGAKQRMTDADRKRYARKVTANQSAVRKGLGKLKATFDEVKKHAVAKKRAEKRIKKIHRRIARRVQLGRRGETGRSVPTWMYVLAAAGFYVIMMIVDRGALLALGLSLGVTTAFAIAAPAVELLSAHTAGVYFWRRQEAISPDVEISPHEHTIGTVAVVVGIAHALIVGLIRGLRSGLLAGLLFCVVALALFVGMTYLAYRHHDDDAAELNRVKFARWWADRRGGERERAAQKQGAKVRSLLEHRRGIASARVARWDAAIAAGSAAYGERTLGEVCYQAADPAWIVEERRIAAGDLPEHLLPFDLRAWIERPADHQQAAVRALRRST
ncbi:MAG: hypothetical protein ACRDY6_10405 [Acidimicrobiia bacterium]